MIWESSQLYRKSGGRTTRSTGVEGREGSGHGKEAVRVGYGTELEEAKSHRVERDALGTIIMLHRLTTGEAQWRVC